MTFFSRASTSKQRKPSIDHSDRRHLLPSTSASEPAASASLTSTVSWPVAVLTVVLTLLALAVLDYTFHKQHAKFTQIIQHARHRDENQLQFKKMQTQHRDEGQDAQDETDSENGDLPKLTTDLRNEIPIPPIVVSLRESDSHSPILAPYQQWILNRFIIHSFIDYTWINNRQVLQFQQRFAEVMKHAEQMMKKEGSSVPPLSGHSKVVNDVVDYLKQKPSEGFIVSLTRHTANPEPHPLPLSSDLDNTCRALNIDNTWVTCHHQNVPRDKLNEWLPVTRYNLVVVIFNAFVDPGFCHPEASGAVYTPSTTFHFQRWTNNACYNDAINSHHNLPIQYFNSLINAVNQYNGAPGHFSPQQLPRILRSLAVAPMDSKLLVADGGIPRQFMDILVERNIVDRERIVYFNPSQIYFAHAMWKGENYPYAEADNQINNFMAYERSDMQLVRAALTDELPLQQRKSIVYIQREAGSSRSIRNEAEVLELLESVAAELGLKVEIFVAAGHLREHIAMFQRARILVAPHGAGLSNLYWVAAKSYVIEFGYNTGMPLPDMYFQMSSHLDHFYYSCKAQGDYSSPMTVDMKEFTWQMKDITRRIKGLPFQPHNSNAKYVERFLLPED